MTAITIENLSKKFEGTVALDALSLQINAGEIFFLLGPSGCGKTTLLRTLAGFTEPDAGRILFGTEDVTTLPPHRRQTGMMFQSYALWPHMTVAKNVAFGLEERRVPRPEIRRRVEEALASVQMSGYGERHIHQLSGGQQQRVALARALVIRPHCLLLDEPLSNLDTRLRLEMRSEIRRICREARLTAIYVTHDQKEALSIADRMAILRHGRLLQTGTPAELYRRPGSKFVAEFMGEANFLPGQVIETGTGRIRVKTEIGAFLAEAGEATYAGSTEVLLAIRPEAWRLDSLPTAVNTVTGKVAEHTYLGEMAEYLLAFPSAPGTRLKTVELNPQEPARARGSTVFASVVPGDITILPHEP